MNKARDIALSSAPTLNSIAYADAFLFWQVGHDVISKPLSAAVSHLVPLLILLIAVTQERLSLPPVNDGLTRHLQGYESIVWQTMRDVIIAGSVVFLIMLVLLGDLVAAIAVGLMVRAPGIQTQIASR